MSEEEILRGIEIKVDQILEERGKLYNTGSALDPESNFECAYRLKWDYTKAVVDVGRKESGAHHHAICMVLLKIARIATGVPNAENYLDAIGYLKLAQRIALREKT